MSPHVLLHQCVLDNEVHSVHYLSVDGFAFQLLNQWLAVPLTLPMGSQVQFSFGTRKIVPRFLDDFLLPHFEHLFDPEEDEVAFLIGRVLLASGFKLFEISNIRLLRDFDQFVYGPVSNPQIVFVGVATDVGVKHLIWRHGLTWLAFFFFFKESLITSMEIFLLLKLF